jgi:rod shape-determining protein MreC
MSFLQKNNSFTSQYNREKKPPVISILVIIFIIIILSLPITRNLLFYIGTPIWKIKTNITIFLTDNYKLFSSKKTLIQENLILKDEITTLSQEKVFTDIIKRENEDLKSIFLRKNKNQDHILATVLVKPFLSPYDTLIIDVGTQNGVTVGNSVLVQGNIFIGYISEVNTKSSKVILHSSPGEKTNVIIGENNISKEALGMGNGNFILEVPRELGIQQGDSITIPSIYTNIFSVVERIEFKETDAFQTIFFKNPINISELKWVEVLLN